MSKFSSLYMAIYCSNFSEDREEDHLDVMQVAESMKATFFALIKWTFPLPESEMSEEELDAKIDLIERIHDRLCEELEATEKLLEAKKNEL